MFLNVAAYKFVAIDYEKLPILCKQLRDASDNYALKGTILLGLEGINLFLAGSEQQVGQFESFLRGINFFQDIIFKKSYSDFIPFKKMVVKIRKEIVTFQQQQAQPEQNAAPYISATNLKQWLDDNKDFILLDTRNEFEYKIGTFKKATQLNIKNFRELPVSLNSKEIDKNKPIVTFCTGGIRCEKAAPFLLANGFKEVYQLQGGILTYFEHCGDAHFQGDCFVFDDRIAVNSQLQPTKPSCS